MNKITPFLWFNDKAEEAVNFYTSIFKNSKVITINKYPDSVPGMAGKVITAVFELDGQRFMALDGGPQYKFSEAISLLVDCESQEEVDELWTKLTEGGEESQCGWLKDKYGLSWQVIPKQLGTLMSDPNPTKAKNVMDAMLKMKKIVIKDLEEAYNKE